MNNISVESLRQAGYKVWIRHNRFVVNPSTVLTNFKPGKPIKARLMPWSEIKQRKYNNYVLSKGGLVEVELRDSNGVTVKATAKCWKCDPYVKREGVKRALEKAYAILHSNQFFVLDVDPVKFA
jgi:hypothetical protein